MKQLGFCRFRTCHHWIFLLILFVGLFSHIDAIPVAGAYSNDGNDVISYLDADDYVGQTKTVKGMVVDTFKYTEGNVIFLNFHDPYEGYFTVVIWSSDWSKFPMSPEIYYKYEEVRVTGEIIEYRGSSEIVVSDPSQIKIVTDEYTATSSYNREYNDYTIRQRYDDYVDIILKLPKIIILLSMFVISIFGFYLSNIKNGEAFYDLQKLIGFVSGGLMVIPVSVFIIGLSMIVTGIFINILFWFLGF